MAVNEKLATPQQVLRGNGPGDNAAFWKLQTSALLIELDTTADGLSSQQARLRLSRYGPNDVNEIRHSPAWIRFGKRFANPLVMILLLASALSAATGDVASFVIIATIVLASVLLDFVQETRAQNTVDALRAQVALKADVLRDRALVSLPVADLVPGDVVHLAAGDLVPADGVLLASKDFFVNQALLTGESFPVEKHVAPEGQQGEEISAAANVGLGGTSVVSGSATFLLCRTGRQSAFGKLADSLIAAPPPTSFEIGLRRFSMLILKITAVLVLLVMAESMARHRPWIESLVFALALAVGLTPELLPMIMTITLARGAVRLSRKRVIVKRLAAIYNLGAMDVLCTDKTGTLTDAHIVLTKHVDIDGNENENIFSLAWLNSYFESGLKSPLDDAILAHGGVDATPWLKIDEVPFDFERRRVSVLVEREGARTLIVKGAPEDVIRLCTRVDLPGGAGELTDEQRASLLARFKDLSTQGFRLLGIASRAESATQQTILLTDEAGLTFSGFAVFLDPPKASAKAALTALASASVAVKVLTGDNEQVARHLCAELDFDPGQVINGAELVAMSDEALLGRLAEARLFCRVTPQQKLRIILALKSMGRTVGFMGDGINDAPALHVADVGISVDEAADVAKAAADIILLDQDLGVVHEGVMEGRRTVVNTGKYILMAGSANLGNIFSMVLAGIFLPFLPLLPIQVLLTNLIFDVAQLALPLDNVDGEAIEHPIHWDMGLIKRFMFVMGPVSTVFDALTFAALILIFHAERDLFRTGWFLESLVTQILIVFALRTRRHIFASRPNRTLVILTLAMSALTLVLPFVPLASRWFAFVHPPASYFGLLFLIVITFLVAAELTKRAFYAHVADPASTRTT